MEQCTLQVKKSGIIFRLMTKVCILCDIFETVFNATGNWLQSEDHLEYK